MKLTAPCSKELGFLFQKNMGWTSYKIHSSHQEVVSCQKLAQDAIFWPNINEHISNSVSSSLTCLQYSRSNKKQPLQQHPVPNLPWENIGIDFMHVETLLGSMWLSFKIYWADPDNKRVQTKFPLIFSKQMVIHSLLRLILVHLMVWVFEKSSSE